MPVQHACAMLAPTCRWRPQNVGTHATCALEPPVPLQCWHPPAAGSPALPVPTCSCNAITHATLSPLRRWCPHDTGAHAMPSPMQCWCPHVPGVPWHPGEPLTAHLSQRYVGALYAGVLVALRVQAPPHPLLVGLLRDREKGAQWGPAPPAPCWGHAGGGSRPGCSGRTRARGRVSLPGRAPPWLRAQPPLLPHCVLAISPAAP